MAEKPACWPQGIQVKAQGPVFLGLDDALSPFSASWPEGLLAKQAAPEGEKREKSKGNQSNLLVHSKWSWPR